jgi:prephenate dehydrogenase
LSAKLHDEIVAWTSHLPQLVSSALAACLVENLPNEDHLRIAGSGLR